jgi:hypothetical protein
VIEEESVNERLVQCVMDARAVLGALRAFVPDDVLPLVNRFLVHLGAVELEATGDCSPEGCGWTHDLAVATIRNTLQGILERGW